MQCLQAHALLADVDGKTDCVRLRRYDAFSAKGGETFGGREKDTLKDLGLSKCHLVLEVRRDGDVFAEHGDMMLRVRRWGKADRGGFTGGDTVCENLAGNGGKGDEIDIENDLRVERDGCWGTHVDSGKGVEKEPVCRNVVWHDIVVKGREKATVGGLREAICLCLGKSAAEPYVLVWGGGERGKGSRILDDDLTLLEQCGVQVRSNVAGAMRCSSWMVVGIDCVRLVFDVENTYRH